MQSAPKVTALGLSVKLSIVLLRFIQRNSKALNCDASKKLLRLKYNYPRPVPPKSGPSLGLCVYFLPSCVNVCFYAGLAQSLYILCDCVFPCWTPTRACISYCVNAGPPQSLYILLCERVFPCWTPTELVYLV